MILAKEQPTPQNSQWLKIKVDQLKEMTQNLRNSNEVTHIFWEPKPMKIYKN
jgi:hypothetical protein